MPRIKTAYIAAIAVAAMTGMASVQVAKAQIYVEARGGASFFANADIVGPGSPDIGSEIDFETGFLSGGVVGYDLAAAGPSWAHDLRIEIEGVFGKGGFDSVSDEPDNARGSLSGDGGAMTVKGGLVNVTYDVPVARQLGGFQPYVAGGIGGAKIDVDGGKPNSPDGIDDSEPVFLYQARTGLGYDLGPGWSLSAGYRYLATPNDIRLKARGIERFRTEFRSHNFEVGVRYSFH